MTRIALLALSFFVASSSAAFAASLPIAPLRLGSYYLNLPTPQVLQPHELEVRFTHRFSQPINQGDAHSLWGLDSSADVAFGVAWSPAKKIDLSLLRSNVQDDLEAAAKYVIRRQTVAFPLSLTSRAGIDWRTEENVDEPLSVFVQLIASRQFDKRIAVFAIPSAATNAGPFDRAFNVPFGAALMINPNVSVIAELIPENRDLPGSFGSDFGWALGVKRALGGHFFEVVLTDSRATHVGQYLSGQFLGSGIRAGNVHLGFNIERRF